MFRMVKIVNLSNVGNLETGQCIVLKAKGS